MSNSLFSIENLTISFENEKKKIIAVNDVSFDIGKSEIVGLVGESGCGKTVTSLGIIGLLPNSANINSGKIHYNGKDILNIKEDEKRKIRGKEISMIFQEPMTSLNPLWKCGNQIGEAIKLHNKIDKKDLKSRVLKIIKNVGLPNPETIYSKYPHELSGGQRQRVMIGIAIANHPDLIIADEPTTALDVTIQSQILELLKKINEEEKSSILFISHDLGVINDIADRVIVMYAGFIVEIASRGDLYSEPKHPYTLKLLQSIPLPEKKGKELESIPGIVPRIESHIDYCPFVDRCSIAKEICREKLPLLEEKSDKHFARCHLT
ncbi:ABC transporter ATP-binding protein [Geotoga petraea]|jgi:oligopeptide/dipeptide ABC transporter ATP-binding protein|uniref:ABC transporter ATP-binding protein n=1 Tax=Geotoga petraea TaxID=28234 RepID=A0A1G6KT95_9BACT|nr:ABC transporter ATP-binding protein [Geotoga petraea]MDK2946530.1 peptide/nickel transport system ATP-binding protein [Geotoga sp.]TGG88729.1 ABC transporter ATP-binding protein [Geotoga petraea]SDC34194.1 peptide/nickel transport system ATP-binding protein [Geotoga petraea]